MFARAWARLIFLALVLLGMGAVVFGPFLFGDKLLLYRDIGSDSVTSYYPDMMHLARYLREDGFPLWSFHAAMGQNLFQNIGAVILTPVVSFSPSKIAELLVYQHLFYVVGTGLLFYKFFELRGLDPRAGFVGAILLSFSAYLCMGSCWTICAEEVVCIALVLCSLELALVRGRWIYLPFAVAIFGLLTVFYLYFCALLLTVYVLARLFLAAGGRFYLHWKLLGQLALLALLGIGLTSPVWLDNLAEILDSPRASGTTSYAHQLASSGVFTLASTQSFLTALLRPFSNDLIGLGNDFRGAQNYFEAPISYCGLLPLLLFPQVFAIAGTRRHIVAGVLLGAIVITTAFPWFRYFFWLFQGDYHRTLTFFFSAGSVGFSVFVLSRYLRERALNLWLLLATVGALLALLYFPAPELTRLIDPALRNVAAAFLVAYAALLTAGRFLARESIALSLMIALCAGELCYFDQLTVVRRPTVTKAALKSRESYNDFTVEAVREIQAGEEGFYRISKHYPSSSAQHRSLNDALVFGFDGSSSYSSFNSIHYINFLKATGSLPNEATEIETRWTNGLVGRGLFAAFACEKYVLTQQPAPYQAALAFDNVQRYGDIFVFRNRAFLPLGLFLENIVPEKNFNELSIEQRQIALLDVATVPEDTFTKITGREAKDAADFLTSLRGNSVTDLLARRRETALRVSSFSQSRIAGAIECATDGVLLFQTPFDPGWKASVDGASVVPVKADFGLLGFPLRSGQHQVEIRYSPPLAWTGAIIAALSATLLGLGFWRWPRLEPILPNESQPRRNALATQPATSPTHPAPARSRSKPQTNAARRRRNR